MKVIAAILLLVILVSGCTSVYVSDNRTSDAQVNESLEQKQTTNEPPLPPPIPEIEENVLPEGAVIELSGLALDSDLYHSKEVMMFNVTISSNVELDGLILKSNLDEWRVVEETMDIVAGDNDVRFGYQLPSCNTCSGVRAGVHDFHVNIYYDSLIDGDKVSVDIQQ